MFEKIKTHLKFLRKEWNELWNLDFDYEDEEVVVCNVDSNLKECSLVEKMRQLQANKEILNNEIENINTNVNKIQDKFRVSIMKKFIIDFCSENYYPWHHAKYHGITLDNKYYDVNILKLFSEYDLIALKNEFKSIENTLNILEEYNSIIGLKKQRIETINAEISEIKQKLGIQ